MITIINTGIGNFKSVQGMLTRIGVHSMLSAQPEDILKAEKIILPGIGSFDRGMEELNKSKLIEVIRFKVQEEKTKILGICLGMQMLGQMSEEGSLPGLSLIDGQVKKFNFQGIEQQQRKIPHMGWNYTIPKEKSVLFDGFDLIPRFYFTHSYYFDCQDETQAIATTPYGFDFASAVQHDNIFGVQFHPEKSHRFGMQLLSNFVKC